MDDPHQRLLQQLAAQVQALYDSPPGSAPQREADKWLTGLVGLEGAWPVLLRVVGPAAGSGQASPFDVRLTFIAAKIMQLKIQRDWRTCPPEIRQAVQATLVAHLQQQALGGAAAPHDAPIVQNQLVLAFVHLLLQALAETARGASGENNGGGGGGEFVMEVCRLFGITGAPDLGTQLRPLLLLLSILKGLPEEHNRRGGAGGGGMDGMGGQPQARAAEDNGPLRIPEGDARTVVNLVGSVLAQCDAAEAAALSQGGAGDGSGGVVEAARRAKLAALQCLQAWAMYVMQAPAWVTLGDMAAWGLLPVLEAQVALAGTPRALEPEAFCTVLATITDGLRSTAEEEQHDRCDAGGGGYYGPAAAGGMNGNGNGQAGGGREGEERRRRREEVLRSVARVLVGIGRYVVQPGNAYAEDEDVPRSACEGLLTFLERHLEPLWERLGAESGGGGGGAVEAAVPMVRELLQLLLAFTGHADVGGVALPTLELWVYLPEMLGLLHEPTSASPAAAALLGEVQPALVELLARQCMGSPKWTAREWRMALAGGGGGRGAARLLQGGEGGEGEEEDEEGFGRLADALSFRSEAVDAAESMASGWPERHRVGELLYGVMAQRSGDPLAVEAVLWLLAGVARGLQRGAELMEDYGYGDGNGDDDEEDDEDGGGYYGPASAASSASPDRAVGRRAAARERQRAFLQPQLWEAVIQGLSSLQDPGACVYLWHTAALLLHDLTGLFLAEAPPPLIEAAAGFLLRALAHPVTCTAAAAALKQICLRGCDRDRGALGGHGGGGGGEPAAAAAAAMAAAARLAGAIAQALQAAHTAQGGGGGGNEGTGPGLLMRHPRAYADLTEALLLLMLRSSSPPNVDALSQTVTATIAAPPGGFPRRADRALVLCAALQALHRGAGPQRGGGGGDGGGDLVDAVVERAWPAVNRSLFGPLDAEAAVAARQRQEKREQRALLLRRGGVGPPPPQQHPLGRCDELSGAVGACCDVLVALFTAVGAGSKARVLPLLLGKALSLIEYNAGALAAFREAAKAGTAADTRRAADEAGVLLWPGPLAFLRRVLCALWEEEEDGGKEDEGHYGPAAGTAATNGGGGGGGMVQGAQAWWGLLQQATDAGLGLARAALALRVADEDEACGDPGRRQLLVRFYEEAFLLAREAAGLGVPSEETPALAALPPPSAVGADPYAVRRGLELVVLALEIPLENSASLRAALSLLEALLRQQTEDALLPLLQDLPPRLLPALLRALVATVNLPSNVRRQISDLLHLLLSNNSGSGSGNGPLPRASALFQQALAALLAGGDGSAALHALFAHDPAALAFVGQGLAHLATGQMGREPLREFVRCFAGLGRGEMTVAEAQEGMAAVAAGGGHHHHPRRGC